MKKPDFALLLFLAQRAGLHNSAVLPTSQIARGFNTSQQSASRNLRLLEGAGLINRAISAGGTQVSLTKKGRDLLGERLAELNNLFKKQKTKTLTGSVVSGLGEGSYYLSQPKYLSQIEKALGFTPYIGTLNLRVGETELKNFLGGLLPIFIDGFSDGRRTFGSSRCFQVAINKKTKGAVVVPERTTNPPNIVEVIAPVSLRRKFSLKDGSMVVLEALA